MSVPAYRLWRLGFDDDRSPVLLSLVVQDTRWPGPVLKANCAPVIAPHSSGSCVGAGIHAWKRLDSAIQPMLTYRAPVIGRVDLFGHIVEHEYGYRAEAAVVRALALTPFETAAALPGLMRLGGLAGWYERLVAPLLEQRYQCDVRLVRGFGDLYRVLVS